MAASALDLIIQWAQGIYDWQSDAIRRILVQGDVTEDDEKQILLMLRERNGIKDPDNPAPKPQPLKKSDISGASPGDKLRIILKAMNDLENVNALPKGSSLQFAHEGISVIYGENGTGKSGYARVLKKACRARDPYEKLHQNVFDKGIKKPAKASFKILINDNKDDTEIPWADEGAQESSEILSNICVFDSKCCRVIVDEENKATYLPYGAGIFYPLVNMHKRFRAILEKENPKPEKLEYSDIPATTTAGKMIFALSASTKIEPINDFAKWEDTDEERLTFLKTEIIEAQNNDPLKMAQKLRNTKKRFGTIIASLTPIEKSLSAEKENAIKDAITSLEAAEKAHKIASEKEIIEELLHGVGEKAWQALYKAAKEYSTTRAYPSKEFPVLDDGSICVLCMQPLETQEVKNRMLRFKEFMESSTKTAAEKAEKTIKDLQEELAGLKFPSPEDYKDLYDEYREKYPETIGQAEKYFSAMKKRAAALEKDLNKKTSSIITAPIPTPEDRLQEISTQLEEQAEEKEKDAKTEELNKKIIERDELAARKLFHARKDTITGYLKKLQLSQKYDLCWSQAEFGSITKKGNAIVKAALTPQLKTEIETELEKLEAKHLPVYPKPIGEEGQTLHKLELDGSIPLKKINLSEILSEGEHCVVGIAGFLAELELADHKCPIILDDPVCSLDHKYMGRIAKRLAEEAKKRQVITFTHDIAFLLELENCAVKAEVPCMAQTLHRLECVGKCIEGLPWHAMDVGRRLDYLRRELASFKDLCNTNRPEYNKKAADLYGLLRESWEAFIEQNLLFKTISRHCSEVQTQRLRYVSVEDNDYKKIHLAMADCSTWMIGHDKSKALNVDRPNQQTILNNIEELSEYVKEIKGRNKEVEKRREKMLQPAQASVG